MNPSSRLRELKYLSAGSHKHESRLLPRNGNPWTLPACHPGSFRQRKLPENSSGTEMQRMADESPRAKFSVRWRFEGWSRKMITSNFRLWNCLWTYQAGKKKDRHMGKYQPRWKYYKRGNKKGCWDPEEVEPGFWGPKKAPLGMVTFGLDSAGQEELHLRSRGENMMKTGPLHYLNCPFLACWSNIA
jgi:hypothetical protein